MLLGMMISNTNGVDGAQPHNSQNGIYSGLMNASNSRLVEVYQCALDELYVTKNPLNTVDKTFNWELPNAWAKYITLHAFYTDGDTSAGNTTYKDSTKVRLKKRFKGDFNWTTIYEQDVIRGALLKDTINIVFDDYLEPNKRVIEYAYVAVINDEETNPIPIEITSKFFNYWIIGQLADQNQAIYPAMFNIEHNVQLNRPGITVVAPGRRYPYVITNGISHYYSGTFTATFLPYDTKHYLPDVTSPAPYRNKIDEFLQDGAPKLLKTLDGDMYIITIIGGMNRTNHNNYQNVSQSFEWTECGNAYDAGDLYDYGFINTDVDRRS